MERELDRREMVFWVAELNGSRHWPTARGSASACWGVLCGEQNADPLELQTYGWRVIKCVATAVETDLRFLAVAEAGHRVCEFCGDQATTEETFDQTIFLCDQCKA